MNSKTLAAAFGVAALALAVVLFVQLRANAVLKAENQKLQAEISVLDAANEEHERRAKEARAVAAAPAPSTAQASELMKLRGEVGTLRKTAEEAVAAANAKENPPSVLSSMTRSPEMVKAIRDQQKMGLGMIYKGLTERASLPKEKADALNDLLADHVMTNINHLTELLGAGKSMEEMEKIFTAQESETDRQVRELLGPEAFEKYKDYNRDLGSYLTSEQFKGMMLKGDKETKDAQAKQLFALMQEETSRALTSAGLPKDYQTVPTLNFRNIASEQYGERSLQLLDSIYENVATRAGTFLSGEELDKFGEFRKMAINNNRLALTMNRKMMAPPNK